MPLWSRRTSRTPPQWTEVVASCRAVMERRQANLVATWGTAAAHWHYDLDEGVMELFDPERPVAQHRITVVGSTSAHEGSWLWGWANDSLPSIVTAGLDRVRAYGEMNGFDRLTTPEWPIEEPHMGDVTAVAGAELKAQGYFRTTKGDVSLYLLLDAEE